MLIGKTIRKLQAVGHSLMVSVPQEYAKEHSFSKGDSVEIYFNDFLHVAPVDQMRLERKLEIAKAVLRAEKDADNSLSRQVS